MKIIKCSKNYFFEKNERVGDCADVMCPDGTWATPPEGRCCCIAVKPPPMEFEFSDEDDQSNSPLKQNDADENIDFIAEY